MSYFKDTGIIYLKGGVQSGFEHVERDVYPTRLYHIKGKRIVRMTEIEVHYKNVNDGDVFILDVGLHLYLVGQTNAKNHFIKSYY